MSYIHIIFNNRILQSAYGEQLNSLRISLIYLYVPIRHLWGNIWLGLIYSQNQKLHLIISYPGGFCHLLYLKIQFWLHLYIHVFRKNFTVLNVPTTHKITLSSWCTFVSFLTYFFSLYIHPPTHPFIIMYFIFTFLGWFNQLSISFSIPNPCIYVGCSLFIDKLAAIFNI